MQVQTHFPPFNPRVSLDQQALDTRVEEFLHHHQIRIEFGDAVKLARRIFPASVLSWSVEGDPEYGGSWIELDIAEKSDAESALARYDDFMNEWTTRATARVDPLLRVTINVSST